MKCVIYLQIVTKNVTRSHNGFLGVERLSGKSTEEQNYLSLESLEDEAEDATIFPSKIGAITRMQRMCTDYCNIEYAEVMEYDENDFSAHPIEDTPNFIKK